MRLTLVLCSVTFTGMALEFGLRMVYPNGEMPAAHLAAVQAEARARFHEDPECGYLPLTDGMEYGAQGCMPNSYDAKDRKGKNRVLFAGDSVTHRGKIVEGLRTLYGDANYEYWNAGVESFNTKQEWVLYRRFNASLRPDHVVLQFHNNDFRATPLVVRENGQIKVYEPGHTINAWLFQKSYLYRWAWPRSEVGDREARAQEVLESLGRFQSALAQDNIRFSVVLMPILKPLAQWDNAEIWSRERSLSYCKQLDLRYFDLLAALEKGLAANVEAVENPGSGDTWHPSQAMAEAFAQDLRERKLLDP